VEGTRQPAAETNKLSLPADVRELLGYALACHEATHHLFLYGARMPTGVRGFEIAVQTGEGSKNKKKISVGDAIRKGKRIFAAVRN
jgi:hypothetical protein